MLKPHSGIALLKHQPRRCSACAAALLVWLLTAVATAHAGAWITDAHSVCQVWDPNPQIDETVAWSGACAGGRAQGPGAVQWSKGNVVIETDKGEWRDGRQTGKGVQTWSTGSYEGDLSNGEPNGQGVLTMQKLRYEGQFRDGKPNGVGKLTEGGKTVQGTWKDGCLHSDQRKASIGIPLSACR
jgi:hypothetical protein